jgi:MraZ protein
MIFPEQDIGNYLRVLPPAQWLKLLEEIKGMPSDHEQKPILQRIVGRDSTEVKLDSAGRLMIPDIMAEAADIKDEAVLAGNLGHFELWSPARHALLEEKDKAERLNVLKRVRAL